MKIIIIIVAIIIVLGCFVMSNNLNKPKEGFTSTDGFVKDQENYYESRGQLPTDPDAEKFYSFDSQKPLGEQLILQTPNKTLGATNLSNVDSNVARCKNITNFKDMDGTNCGYCMSSKKFIYGDKTGPFTDVCEGTWVSSAEEYEELMGRQICDKVTHCKDMVGEASICAWCPTTNKAMVYTEKDGVIVPKYPDKDKCDDVDPTTGKTLGLVKEGECGQFGKDHPCVGPTENTGPHSMACLQHLWKNSGCSPNGTANPSKNPSAVAWWNTKSWKAVVADMKAWHDDANSPNFDAKHYKGCYGKNPDPCDPKYKPTPVECYQQKFTQAGCTDKGTAYPKTKPNQSIGSYVASVQGMKDLAHDQNASYTDRNAAYGKCYGGHLKAPPAPKIGDYVSYTFSSKIWGPGTKLFGYVCGIDKGNGKLYWTLAQNSTGGRHATKSAHINDPESVEQFLGWTCGPTKLDQFPEVPQMIPLTDLKIEKECINDANCPGVGCALQCVVTIHFNKALYPTLNGTYNVTQDQVSSIIAKAKVVIPSTTLATQQDVANLGRQGITSCENGWFKKTDGTLGVGLSATQNTTGSCGGATSNPGIKMSRLQDIQRAWGGKASVYVTMNTNPSEIDNLLAKVGLEGSVKGIFGKTEYIGQQLPIGNGAEETIVQLHFDGGAKGTDCAGNDIKYYPYPPNACADRCVNTPGCVAMVTGPNMTDRQCWLKSKYQFSGSNPNRTCWKKLK